jgi:4-amino-4-deoxy-L-arabinose transferase-like glycosyltransferase
MRISIPVISAHKVSTNNTRVISREKAWRWLVLSAIVLLAAILRFANLRALGLANHYYAAAVASMLKSWHNFFFVAAEPGASVSVDKPPVGLWIQTISAYFLGVNGLALLLPQILAGILSILVLYHLVRRSFGTIAGLLAALVLAITPVVIATDRNNTIDSTLILTLLLAAWAFIKATESGKWRYLLLGVSLVGLGFNIKMLEAYLPLPAFYLLYLLGAKANIWRKVGRLALASLLLLVISLSWAVIVDLTPANQRPYVGSSGDNSEISLIIGYNGIERLMGMFGRRGAGQTGGRTSQGYVPNPGFPGQPRGQNGFFPSPNSPGTFPPGAADGNDGQQAFPQGRLNRYDGGFQSPNRSPNTPRQNFAGGVGGGFSGTGRAGALRLFIPPLSKEVSWLLPFGLASALLLLAGTRLHWPVTLGHQALILWGGWLLVGGIFFSVAGFFHEYYLSTLAAPLAALVGIGIIQIWRLRAKRPWLASMLLLLVTTGTLVFQVYTARAFVDQIPWLPLMVGLFVCGCALILVTLVRQNKGWMGRAGTTCLVTAILVTPGIWSGLTTSNASENQSLPSAYGGRSSGPANRGGIQVNQNLLDYLQAHTQGTKYLMAVPSSMQGADYVLATGRPVLYLGGFMGQDQVVTPDELAQLIGQGALRYIYWDARGGGSMGGRSDISTWVTSTCKPVEGFETATRNSGAPDGTQPGQLDSNNRQGVDNFHSGGEMQVSLYDCGT